MKPERGKKYSTPNGTIVRLERILPSGQLELRSYDTGHTVVVAADYPLATVAEPDRMRMPRYRSPTSPGQERRSK